MSIGKSTVQEEKEKVLGLHCSWMWVQVLRSEGVSLSVREVCGKDPVAWVEEQDLAHDMTGSRSTQVRLPGGKDKGKASVVYLEGLWTSLLSKWYPDMVSERLDVTTVVILSRAAAQNSNGIEGINT